MDFYCERTNNQIFDEPINAISNIFFIIVSISLFKILRKNQSDKIYYVQPILIFFIGIGSFLFHLKPNLITLYLDIIPIFLFSLSFIFLFNRNVINISHLNSSLLFILFLTLLLFITPKLKYEILNGSEFYFANYFFLAMYTIWLYFKKSDFFQLLFLGFIFFNLSILLRSIDNHICNYLSIGTHFLWHFFNAYLLKILTLVNCRIKQPYL
tara:strand:- start:2942 stop:3574 length:633 start_codon:yes stop_codon:yes gene_type:complete